MLSWGPLARQARAHTIGLSTGEYTAREGGVAAKLSFARAELATLVPSMDANRDGHLSPFEVEGAKGALTARVLGKIRVTAGASAGAADAAGDACTPVLTDAGLTEQDGLLLGARWDCPRGGPFTVELALLEDLARGHRHIARTTSDGGVHDRVHFGEDRRFDVLPDAPAAAAEIRPGGPAPGAGGSAFSFFRMGIEHILTGFDHLVFIAGLVLVRARLRALLLVITAFTIAHSMTLALAVLDVWAPSPRFVEPAIALSIAYVGVENFFVRTGERRWRITFPFGLVHGFGFAGALREAGLVPGTVPMALVSFNLGVEAGQLAVLAVLLPILVRLHRQPWFERSGVRVASGLVALAGIVWFVLRIAG